MKKAAAKGRAPSALDKIRDNEPSAAIYARLLQRLEAIGRFAVEPKATSVHIANGRAFLGVHWRKTGLQLSIVLVGPLDSARLKKSEQLSRSRWHHEVVLTSPRDVDAELVRWIKEAHKLTAK